MLLTYLILNLTPKTRIAEFKNGLAIPVGCLTGEKEDLVFVNLLFKFTYKSP